MIELKTSDGYPIRFLIRRLNNIIGGDSIQLKTVYGLVNDGQVKYYTLDPCLANTTVTIYNDIQCTQEKKSAYCDSSGNIIIDGFGFRYGPEFHIGIDLLATEHAVVEYVEEKTTELQEQIDNIGSNDNKADKVEDAVNGHLAALNAEGNLRDSQYTIGNRDHISPNSGLLATELAVFNAIQKVKNDIAIKIIDWEQDSNLNDYIETGMYHFAGYRLNANDNLPMTNSGDNDNVAFTLVVDKHEGKFEGSTHIQTVIGQTLLLSNRQGSETKIYTRHAQQSVAGENIDEITWEPWSEIVTSRLLENVDINTGLNDTTEIGLYTGYTVTGEVFKLEVINNYAAAEAASKQIGTVIPNHVLQTIIILSLDGSENTLNRTGVYNGNGYTWNDWKSTGENIQVDEITIEETMDDLITLDFIDVIQNGDDIITDENNLILTI